MTMNNLQHALVNDCSTMLPLQQLTAARLELQLSKQQISKALKLPISYIEAMEAGQFECLPNCTFARGYLRSYANYLRLPSDEIVQILTRYNYEEPVKQKALLQVNNQLKPSNLVVLIASFVIVALSLVLCCQ